MTGLTVDLQEGFRQDEVIVRANGVDVWVKRDVTTRGIVGLADSLHVEVSEPEVTIEVELPRRNLRASVTLPVQGALWLAAQILDGRLELQPSSEPFAYL